MICSIPPTKMGAAGVAGTQQTNQALFHKQFLLSLNWRLKGSIVWSETAADKCQASNNTFIITWELIQDIVANLDCFTKP